jgi:hypothetical protein
MDADTKKKISNTMKGKSNFAGHTHTHATKIQIGISQQGHRNAKDHKWVTDKESGEEHRVKGDKPRGSRWGRTGAFSHWVHAKEEKEVWDKPNPAKTHHELSSSAKAKAKARAKAAGRSYPNMVDNMWAARNEEKVVSGGYRDKTGTWHPPVTASTIAKQKADKQKKIADALKPMRKEDTSADRLQGTTSLRQTYTKDTPGQSLKKIRKYLSK